MEIIKLPFGERAPVDSDCLSIEYLRDGRFRVSGTLLSGEDSTALVGIVCDSREAAEDQGLAWMNGCDIQQVYVASFPAVPAEP